MNNNTAVVSWTASQSRMCDVVIAKYRVRYKQTNGTGDYSTEYASSTSVTLQSLTQCDTEYSVSVAAINSIGNMSAYSATRNFYTVMPEVTPGETNYLHQWSK